MRKLRTFSVRGLRRGNERPAFVPRVSRIGQKKGKLKQLENRRTLYDNIALALSVCPVLITAPIGLYMAIRYWNAPTSIVPRGKWRFVLAIIFALVQIGIGITLIVAASHSPGHR